MARRKPNRFLELLTGQVDATIRGAKALETYVAGADEAAFDIIRDAEREGDELRRILIDELHNTFVTPFDREDIFNLSLFIDDVLDYVYTTVVEMQELDVAGDDTLRDMVKLVSEAAEELGAAVERLDTNPRVALDHARRIKRRENGVERVYRIGLADLFRHAEDISGILNILRRREVYRHVSNAADQADQAANVIGQIVVKMT